LLYSKPKVIDADFYETNEIPPERRRVFPDWLVAIAFKVRRDLAEKLSSAATLAAAVSITKAYISEHRLAGVEPIQVSLLYRDLFVYHEWMSKRSKLMWGASTTEVAGAGDEAIPVIRIGQNYRRLLEQVATSATGLCIWQDVDCNNPPEVRLLHRSNLGLFERASRHDVHIFVEIHWGPDFQQFEHQAIHLKGLIRPVRIEIIDVSATLIARLLKDPSELYRIGPVAFEDLVENRFVAMGFSTKRIGKTYSKDGGIDLLFWKDDAPIPFLGAAQMKYHSKPDLKTGPGEVREFAGVVGHLPVSAGVLVTNTSFSYDAKWIAKKVSSPIRLRDQVDLRRWISGRFVDQSEWRELPDVIELCPGVTVAIPRPTDAGR